MLTINLHEGDNFLVLTDDDGTFVDLFQDYEQAIEFATLLLDENSRQVRIVRVRLF